MDRFKKIETIICGCLLLLVIISGIYLTILNINNKETVIQDANKAANEQKVNNGAERNAEDERMEKIKILELIYNKEKTNTNINEENETVDEEIDDITKEEFESSDQIYSYNGSYVYGNNMDFSYLDESQWMIKYEDKNYISILGLDVSEYNGSINFYSLKEQGFDFVMLRVGWRGSTEGGIYKDKYFEDYYYEAVDAGLNVGYYFFSQAINDEEAIEEAEFVLDTINGKHCDMFVAYDMETSIDGDGRSDDLGWKQRTSNALSFSKVIAENGYEPMIYTNLDWAKNYYDVNDFNDKGIAIWLAQYNDYPNVNFDYAMWQYTAKATIPGVSLNGRTDINLMLVEK